MSARPWISWWGDEPRAQGRTDLEPAETAVVCGDCVVEDAPEERHCGPNCPLSVLDLRARRRYGPGATANYPRVLRVGTPMN